MNSFKLLLAGNLANYSYFLTKLIRKQGIDAHLLMQKYPGKSEDPRFFEENFSDYPEWIEFWDNKKRNWKWQIIKKMRKYDLIQSSTELPIFSLFVGKPNISWTTGSDVIELAHQNSLKGFLLRAAYRRSKVLIFAGLYMYDSVQKLKIKKALFIPPIWDYTKFFPRDYEKKSKFVIFHPTGHVWRQKGNQIFLKAFVRLAKDFPQIKLIMINRGEDFWKSLEIIQKANLLERVDILPKEISQNDLIEYYNKSDVVVDQFILGSTGLIGQEAMACEKPVIQFMNKDLHKKFYAEIPPIINSQEEKQIYDNITKLVEDNKFGREIGIKSREWLLKYHNIEKNIQKYIFVYNAVHEGIEFKKISEHINSMKY